MPLKAKLTRVDNAYERLKSEILKGELPAGFQAPEPELADRLGMSRTPVREALIRLEAERLVHLVPRRGARVLPVERRDLCEIFEILAVLGALAAAKAARKNDDAEALEEMASVVDDAEAAVSTRDMEAWARHDDRFHRLVAKAGDNARLAEEVNRLLNESFRAHMVLLRLSAPYVRIAGKHRSVLDAIREGDEEAAYSATHAFRLASLKSLKEVLETSGLTQV
ncbi:GntR family transcriptional regulator [Rhodobacterales bacterium]|nr:GntR family transcriptional regulator [Rhodobacterales bacterium]